MTKQTFKKHQFIICTFFVFIGLITIYSTSYGGTYTGGPAGGSCRNGAEADTSDSIVTSGKATTGFRTDDNEGHDSDGEYYKIMTFQDSIYIYLNFRSTVSYTDVNGETHILIWAGETEDNEEYEFFISELQSNTEYRIGISGILCGYTMVETEPVETESVSESSDQSEFFVQPSFIIN